MRKEPGRADFECFAGRRKRVSAQAARGRGREPGRALRKCREEFMEERELAIHVEGLSKVYKLYNRNRDRLLESLGLARKPRSTKHYALRNVDLDIYKGETVGIIGTNGSGKSTILKIITGVLHETEGTVQVNGRISALLELGAGFNMEYNGIENIYLNGTMIGFSEKEIDEKLQDILDFADIGDYVYQPVKTYSSGMFVRLAFAVAINIDPEILIVDEALSVGDVFFQAKCYRKFEEFKKKGKTILFVSHDLSAISKYCDRAVLLNQGEKLGEGSPKEMIDAYKQVLVGQYETPRESENVPDLAADRCLDCPLEPDCPYSAPRFYLDRWKSGHIDNYIESVTSPLTEENILRAMREGPYGRCVFACDTDVVDHQVVNVERTDGSTFGFTMTGFTEHNTRFARFFGTAGELSADLLSGDITLTPFGKPAQVFHIDAAEGHSGGDAGLVKAFVELMLGGEPGPGLTSLDVSLESHRIALAAEKSRLAGGAAVELQ